MKLLDLELKKVPLERFIPMVIGVTLLWAAYFFLLKGPSIKPSAMFVATMMNIWISYLVGCGNTVNKNWRMTVPFLTLALSIFMLTVYVGVNVIDPMVV